MKEKAMKKIYKATALFATGIACSLCIFAVKHFTVNASETIKGIDVVPNLDGFEVDTLPNGLKGETYPVFDCDIVSEKGETLGKANALVYTPNGELAVTKDGRFSTEETGIYTIEYFAEYNSLQASTVLEVTVVDSGYVEMQSTVEGETDVAAFSFERYSLPTVKTSGGFGNVSAEWTVEYSGESYCDGVEIIADERGDYFIPEFTGVYTWKHIATDIVGKSLTTQGEVVVSDAKTPIMQIPGNSKVCHLGDTVHFNYTQAKLYDNGLAVYVPVSVYVNEEAVTETMSFKPETAGEYTVKYEAKNPFDANAEAAVYTYTLTVIDVASENKPPLYVDQFFQLDGFTSEYRNGSVFENKVYVMKADGEQDEAAMSFKNAINENMIAVKLGFDTAESNVHQSNFKTVTVEFSDTVNGDENITIELCATSDKKVLVTVNELYTATLERSFTENTGNNAYNAFTFVFDRKTKALYENEVLLCKIEKTANGKEFRGFSSGYAYLNMKMSGITAESTLKLYSIATQVINNDPSDKSKPFFITPDDYADGFYVDKGGYAVVKKVDGYDLYSDTTKLSLKILAPDKTIVYTTQDMQEDYTFLVEQDGRYIVSYAIADESGNTRTWAATIYVTDRVAPTIAQVEIAATAKVGDTLKLPACVATDDITQECVTYVYLLKGNFHKELVYEEYTFTEIGDHFFVYGARDEAGNVTTVTYVVNVAPQEGK